MADLIQPVPLDEDVGRDNFTGEVQLVFLLLTQATVAGTWVNTPSGWVRTP